MGPESRPTKRQTKQETCDAGDIIVATIFAPSQGVERMVLSSAGSVDNVLLFSRLQMADGKSSTNKLT